MTKTILFTGAGASYPLGLPTTESLFNKINDNKIKKHLTNTKLFYAISESEGVTDIENMWHILEKMEETDELNNDFSFFNDNIHLNVGLDPTRLSTLPWPKAIETIGNLKREIEDIIFDEYRLSPEKEDEALQLYLPIIQSMMSLNKLKNKIEIPIFTTNYDRVLDEVGSGIKTAFKFEFIDGFKQNYPKPPEWAPDVYSNYNGNLNFLAFHLHGSLKWREYKDGSIKKVHDESHQRDNERFPGRLVVYPGSKNPEEDGIFHIMHNFLEEYLKKAEYCIVIGFAFRDPYINSIFIKSLVYNKKLKIIIISPNAKDKLKENELFLKVKSNKKINNKRLIPFSIPFEILIKTDIDEFLEKISGI